ncbi:MAG TPA: tyrosine-type recombinase/integrase [Chitinophagaceae bacterium]|nr:tyrosine-type recombinase/integrase [Chitinophagaceae bacterium]
MKITFLIDDFGHFIKYEKRQSSNTYQSYLSDLRDFALYLEEEYAIENIAEVSWMHIRSYFVALAVNQLAHSSLLRKQSAMNQFFEFAVYKAYLSKNPVRKFPKRSKPKRLPVSLNEQQTTALFEGLEMEGKDAKEQGDILIIELLFQTGIRVSELTSIQLKHIDFSEKTLKIIGKGQKWRVLPLMQPLLGKILLYLESKEKESWGFSKYLLTLKSGQPLYRQYVYRVVQRYLSSVSKESYKGPHVLRHSFATQLLNSGANLMHIKELLGHENLESTQIYTQVHIDRLKEIHKKAHPKS